MENSSTSEAAEP